MKSNYYGFYSTHVYLPVSGLLRSWRRFANRARGRTRRFLQETRLPQISWKDCVSQKRIKIWEHKKLNGNVRISELGVLAQFAANCTQGTNLFEIGTFDGRTTLNLALNSPARCRIHTLDLSPGQETKYPIAKGEMHMIKKGGHSPGARYEKYRANFPDAVGKIDQLLGDSATFHYEPYVNSCSLVFVDGSHAYNYALSDTQAAFRLVNKEGVIIWHDYGIWEGVTKALEEVEDREKHGLINIKHTSLVLWKNNRASLEPQEDPQATG